MACGQKELGVESHSAEAALAYPIPVLFFLCTSRVATYRGSWDMRLCSEFMFLVCWEQRDSPGRANQMNNVIGGVRIRRTLCK